MAIFEKRHHAGFSLVEVLVVAAIISLLSAITITSLNNTRIERTVRAASAEVAASLREAQNYALTGKSTSLSVKNCWHAVEFQNATDYRIISQPKDRSGNCTASVVPISSFSLTNGVQLGGIPTPYRIGFLLPRAEAQAGAGAIGTFATPLRITLTRSLVVYSICVYPSGRVEERYAETTCP